MFTNENGVSSNSDANDIPSVCDNNNDILIPLINVDLPPAFGPVRIILLGLSLPIFIVLDTMVLSIRDGCHILFILSVGFECVRYFV